MGPSGEHGSKTFAFLSPCLALLSWQWVSHRVCLPEKLSGSAVLTFLLNARSTAFHSFDTWMLACFLRLIPLVLPQPLRPLCTACPLLLFSSSKLNFLITYSRHCSALSLLHVQVILTQALHVKTFPNSCIIPRRAYGQLKTPQGYKTFYKPTQFF